MKPFVWKEGMPLEESEAGACWERNMLALYFDTYSNKVWEEFNRYVKSTLGEPDPGQAPCGWYYDTDNNWDGWKRVLSLHDGRITFHIPDDFDIGKLPQIEPNWDGHSTEEKWTRLMNASGCNMEGKL